ncbi:hypothetical protein IAD21_05942 [Abditibacteriota bacterium]|nr:hypothetical protein IAD21_05942 [Abditibacteriota bacterium]
MKAHPVPIIYGKPLNMNQSDDKSFANQWMTAWNAHDLDTILAHYADDIEFSSPFASRLVGDSLVRGRDALREYFSLALERFPDLHFSDMKVFLGANSIVLCYRSVNSLDAAETMVFNESGLVHRVWAHYRETQTDAPIG